MEETPAEAFEALNNSMVQQMHEVNKRDSSDQDFNNKEERKQTASAREENN